MEEIIQTTISTTMNEVIKNSNLLCFDWATLAISIIAIIISVWSVIWTVHRNNKSSYKNNVYEDILKNALHIKLPMHMQKSINLRNRTVNNNEIGKFQDFLLDLRGKILVFKYMDEKFYKEIDKIIIKIDDNIVLINNKQDNFENIYKDLVDQIKELYKCIEKYLFK